MKDKKLFSKSRQPPQEDENSCCPDLGVPDDSSGMDFYCLYDGHGRMENKLDWGYGGLLHHQGGLVLVQPVEILFYRLHSCEQLL